MSRNGLTEKNILVTQHDVKRIDLLLRSSFEVSAPMKRLLDRLHEKLRKAVTLPPRAMPDNVITLDSCCLLEDPTTGEKLTCTLVLPAQADIQEHRISLLSPLGLSVFGHTSGDTVDCAMPDGWRRLTVRRMLYQPEACGLDLT